MRSLIAILTCVGFLANVTIAEAVEGATGAFDGICREDAGQLGELSSLLDEIADQTFEPKTIDPRVEVQVTSVPEFKGPREFGKPSGIRNFIRVTFLTDPLGERLGPLEIAYDQYSSLRSAMQSYSEGVDRLGEQYGDLHAKFGNAVLFRGAAPQWALDADAALASTIVEVGGGLLALGPNLILMPETVFNAPGAIAGGASKMHRGLSAGRYDEAAEGLAEMAGGIGVIAGLAVPIAKGFGIGAGRAPVTLGASARTAATLDAIENAASAPSPKPAPPKPVVKQTSGQATPAATPMPVPTSITPPKAIRMSQKRLDHIVDRHWHSAVTRPKDPLAGKFSVKYSSARVLKDAFDRAVQHGQWSPARDGRLMLRYDLKEAIGVDRHGTPTSTIEIIVKPNGDVVTAYPNT